MNKIEATQIEAKTKIAASERFAALREEELNAEIRRMRAAVDSANASVDRVLKHQSDIKRRANSAASAECNRRITEYADLVSSGADVVGTCFKELKEKDVALQACVRAYRDLEGVYAHDK